jgi:hypothetical protein
MSAFVILLLVRVTCPAYWGSVAGLLQQSGLSLVNHLGGILGVSELFMQLILLLLHIRVLYYFDFSQLIGTWVL